ncbi:MAG TPA: hypothetical protein PKL14_00440 [Holophaga sp.]|nr:hypothetical protein [Holophaga sp.]
MSAPRKLLIVACCTERWMHIPVGVFGVSSYLKRHGLEHQILHTHVQSMDEAMDILDAHIKEGWCFALIMHWKEDCSTFFGVSNYLMSRIHDPSRVVCGGITSSFFAKEIVQTAGLPDTVFRGDPEEPIRKYCQGLPLETIENITWAHGGQIEEKPITWRLDTDGFSSLSFTDFSMLIHRDRYFRAINRGYLHINISRGCQVNCEFCGGSSSAFLRHSDRTGTIVRPTHRVLEDIDQLLQFARSLEPVVRIHMDDVWDNYFPVLQALSQHPSAKSLFVVVADRNAIDINRLKASLDVFKSFQTFLFEIAPESDDRNQRACLMEGAGKEIYDADYLLEMFDFLNKNGIYCTVFYTVYNSMDTEAQVFRRLKTCRDLQRRVDPVLTRVLCMGLSLDCGSNEYAALPNPPTLADYLHPEKRFTDLLGNLTYIRKPEDVDLILAAQFFIMLMNGRIGAVGSQVPADFWPESEEVMAVIREFQISTLIQQEIVTSGRYADFMVQKIMEKRRR